MNRDLVNNERDLGMPFSGGDGGWGASVSGAFEVGFAYNFSFTKDRLIDVSSKLTQIHHGTRDDLDREKRKCFLIKSSQRNSRLPLCAMLSAGSKGSLLHVVRGTVAFSSDEWLCSLKTVHHSCCQRQRYHWIITRKLSRSLRFLISALLALGVRFREAITSPRGVKKHWTWCDN